MAERIGTSSIIISVFTRRAVDFECRRVQCVEFTRATAGRVSTTRGCISWQPSASASDLMMQSWA